MAATSTHAETVSELIASHVDVYLYIPQPQDAMAA